MEESKLKEILEKEGFERIVGFGLEIPTGEPSEINPKYSLEYLKLATILERKFSEGYTALAIDVMKSEGEDPFFNIYGKR